MGTSKVLAIMGSMSDDEQMAKCIKTLQEAGVNFEHMVISGHRTPELLQEVIQSTDADVIITAAGMSAHLAGISASHTIKPVIGIPLKSSADIDGRGALLSIVNMPKWRTKSNPTILSSRHDTATPNQISFLIFLIPAPAAGIFMHDAILKIWKRHSTS